MGAVCAAWSRGVALYLRDEVVSSCEYDAEGDNGVQAEHCEPRPSSEAARGGYARWNWAPASFGM